ncbi:MAG: hypothetical protein MJ149_01065, partial [Clostridia bacterium]|nr:hypothetical protein [Clostridia bacterium]
NTFKETISLALEKRDASLVAKRIMEMCKQFNKFYTNNKILEENAGNTKAKINLVKSLKETLAVGFYIICIDTLKEM